MKLLVAGAGGRTGTLLVRLALDGGHDVTALVRDRERLPGAHPRLRVVAGDVLEAATLAPAVEGQDAVISLVAPRPRRSGAVYVEGARNLADAAVRAGVRRFIAVSAEGAVADRSALPLGYRLVMRTPVVARLYPDIARMHRELEARPDLDWTIVAPPVLTNRRGGAPVRTRVGGPVPGGLSLPRADLARFLLDVAVCGSHVREHVAVAR